MDEPSRRNGELLVCHRCSRPYDPGDRFCRKCGASLSALPVARDDMQPVVWRSPVPTLARGATAIIIGTLAEIIIRRAIRMVFRPTSLLPSLRPDSKAVIEKPGENGFEPDAVIESEAFSVRRVRVRRSRES
ncbi:MAG: zinc ribbon domain-containing protein [Dehalococcoidia bacterium]|jgi:ribosomal protein L40E